MFLVWTVRGTEPLRSVTSGLATILRKRGVENVSVGDVAAELGYIDDIIEPLPGYILPDVYHVATLVDFLMGWPGERPILLHCIAGISRSMAAALIALALDAEGREAEAARCLREAAPHARPNARMIALADDILCREGRLVAACRRMGPATDVASGPLVRLSPLADVSWPRTDASVTTLSI